MRTPISRSSATDGERHDAVNPDGGEDEGQRGEERQQGCAKPVACDRRVHQFPRGAEARDRELGVELRTALRTAPAASSTVRRRADDYGEAAGHALGELGEREVHREAPAASYAVVGDVTNHADYGVFVRGASPPYTQTLTDWIDVLEVSMLSWALMMTVAGALALSRVSKTRPERRGTPSVAK